MLNVGAGSGSQELAEREVRAVEPSSVMVSQRSWGAPAVVRGVAERLPVPDRSFDEALAVLTVHHWTPMCRSGRDGPGARRQAVLTCDPQLHARHWLVWEYLPAALPPALQGTGSAEVARYLAASGADQVPQTRRPIVAGEPVLAMERIDGGFRLVTAGSS